MKIHLKMYSGWWGCAITCNTRWARGGPKTHEAGPTAHEAGPKAHEECYNRQHMPFPHAFSCTTHPFTTKEGFRKLNQTLRITHFWPPCGVRNSNNNSNLSQHHTCRCPSAFVAGTSAGIMLTIWDLQRVEIDWTVSVWFNFRKPSFTPNSCGWYLYGLRTNINC